MTTPAVAMGPGVYSVGLYLRVGRCWPEGCFLTLWYLPPVAHRIPAQMKLSPGFLFLASWQLGCELSLLLHGVIHGGVIQYGIHGFGGQIDIISHSSSAT